MHPPGLAFVGVVGCHRVIGLRPPRRPPLPICSGMRGQHTVRQTNVGEAGQGWCCTVHSSTTLPTGPSLQLMQHSYETTHTAQDHVAAGGHEAMDGPGPSVNLHRGTVLWPDDREPPSCTPPPHTPCSFAA